MNFFCLVVLLAVLANPVLGFASPCEEALLPDTDELVEYVPEKSLSSSDKVVEVVGRFRVNQVLPGIFHLSFATNKEMTMTFLRFQEHFESPRFRGEVFSRTKFRKWYSKDRGSFSYHEDWAGFNIPSEILGPFYDGRFKRITRRERALLDFFRGQKGRYYIIGTPRSSDPDTLKHEIGHGLYYTNAEYRKAVDEILATVDTTPIKKVIREWGYHESVLHDEAHAYLMTDAPHLASAGIDLALYQDAIRRLEENFQKFSR